MMAVCDFYDDRAARIRDYTTSLGADVFVSAEPATVQWLTGWYTDMEAYFAPWSAGDYVIVTPEQCLLLTTEAERAVDRCLNNVVVHSYDGYTISSELDVRNNVILVLSEMFKKILGHRAVVAFEEKGIQMYLETVLRRFRAIIPIKCAVQDMRAVKDGYEVERIRKATLVANTGQQTFRDCLAPGLSEIELWNEVQSAMTLQAGEKIASLVDLMSGVRCEHVGLAPSRKVIENNELCLCDLSPRIEGYWSDSCVTLSVGKPTLDMMRLYDSVRRALHAGIEHVKPGVTARELDGVIRGEMEAAGYHYSHHSGHGIGINYFEEPRIIPNSSQSIEEGMVIALEPGSYLRGLGIRLEHVVLVTGTGSDVLTQYDMDWE